MTAFSLANSGLVLALLSLVVPQISALTPAKSPSKSMPQNLHNLQHPSRRSALEWLGQTMVATTTGVIIGSAAAGAAEIDVESYLQSGGVSMPMGVSGQGGKMRPTTGVVLRYVPSENMNTSCMHA